MVVRRRLKKNHLHSQIKNAKIDLEISVETPMTKLLIKAFDEASKLSKKKQTLLAKQLLEDIKNEHGWDKEFKTSQSKLSKLADKALTDSASGKTHKIGFDDL